MKKTPTDEVALYVVKRKRAVRSKESDITPPYIVNDASRQIFIGQPLL